MRTVLTFAVQCLLVSVAPQILSAQRGADLPARLEPASRAAIVRLADSLAAEHLPTAPVYDKAAEGALGPPRRTVRRRWKAAVPTLPPRST